MDQDTADAITKMEQQISIMDQDTADAITKMEQQISIMDQDTADAITKMEQQMAERDVKFAAMEKAVIEWNGTVDRMSKNVSNAMKAFVEELAK